MILVLELIHFVENDIGYMLTISPYWIRIHVVTD